MICSDTINSELSNKILFDLCVKKARSGGRSNMIYCIGKSVTHIKFPDWSQFKHAESFE